ncbi:DEAD-domain-containing protein [Flagelloscypha sp. PMI_526]|nr:DEAD-domain-containing protein [Flagelloscypha sp. PMI_526]
MHVQQHDDRGKQQVFALSACFFCERSPWTSTVASEHKTKTKAKQRYLKRKKERKKTRKIAAPKVSTSVIDGKSDDDSSESASSRHVSPASTTNEAAMSTTTRDSPQESEPVPSSSTHDDAIIIPEDDQQPLLAFPEPSQPQAPSKSLLALQGLDLAFVQAQVVDCQYRSLYLPFDPPLDACVSAPTGSGKTLAYVVPIVTTLIQRHVTRLRALVVVPTRDLVVQVRETFQAVAKGQGLKIGTATGQHSFAHEQAQLVADHTSDLHGGSSKIDILICTPGRLIDHIEGTKNFTLQHLRYLVIDEADKLLAQSFQDWLTRVISATHMPSNWAATGNSAPRPNSIPVPDAVAPSHSQLLPNPDDDSFPTEKRQSSCQKLLFSATLPRDPGKLIKVGLRNVRYFLVGSQTGEEGVMDVAMEKFSLPSTLKERMIVSDSSNKPLVLFHLLQQRGVRDALVFTKSVENAERLLRLWQHFSEASGQANLKMTAFTSDLSPAERKDILERFKKQEYQVLVCSDVISRGIDISHVSHVVSYDIPLDMRKYVHRVGRTARAGRAGDAWSLVEEQEARWFKSMLKEAGRLAGVQKVKVSEKDLEGMRGAYELKQLYANA